MSLGERGFEEGPVTFLGTPSYTGYMVSIRLEGYYDKQGVTRVFGVKVPSGASSAFQFTLHLVSRLVRGFKLYEHVHPHPNDYHCSN
jgi:hypothetical protein